MKKRKYTYISGPMTGIDGYNFLAFNWAEIFLQLCGHFTINPVKISHKVAKGRLLSDVPRKEYLKADLKALKKCDTIYLLRGWESSAGAKLELKIALKRRMKVIVEGELDV